MGVDLPSRTVLVSYDSMVTAAEVTRLKLLTRRFGDAVRFRRLPGRLTTKIGGGVAIFTSFSTGFNHGRCTLGFNAIKKGEGYYFFTAGHCTDESVWWYAGSNQNTPLGYRVSSIHPAPTSASSSTPTRRSPNPE
ncbi:MAG: hypothetical protein ACRDT4_02055 [Micromonosporaceae bacterium]